MYFAHVEELYTQFNEQRMVHENKEKVILGKAFYTKQKILYILAWNSPVSDTEHDYEKGRFLQTWACSCFTYYMYLICICLFQL